MKARRLPVIRIVLVQKIWLTSCLLVISDVCEVLLIIGSLNREFDFCSYLLFAVHRRHKENYLILFLR